MVITDGSGIYRQDAILGIEVDKDKTPAEIYAPHIEELRMIRGEDGEDYINVHDMTTAMKVVAMSMPLPTLSVLAFIKIFALEILTARR